VIPESENVKRLISAIAEKQLSVKEMMAAVGLRDRPNFIEYSLSPAIREGYVRMLYPDSPRHPRQKYLLTVKGLAAYKELSR
ncbi:MAG: cell filamentation protein Fic, partial [Muribaculaceae bacterium]|nr:cell filamentation protein Fic [Muribaculaceae bacterium]